MIIRISNIVKEILDFLGLKSPLKSIYLKILPYTPIQVLVEEWDSQYSLARLGLFETNWGTCPLQRNRGVLPHF